MAARIAGCLLLALLLQGCGNAVSPEEEAKRLVNLLKYADQEGWDAAQGDLYAMFSRSSKEFLKTRCRPAIDAAAPLGGLPVDSCILFAGFPAGRNLLRTERVQSSASRVRLKLVMERGEALLDLVNEEGRWRLDLEAGLSLSEQGEAAGSCVPGNVCGEAAAVVSSPAAAAGQGGAN